MSAHRLLHRLRLHTSAVALTALTAALTASLITGCAIAPPPSRDELAQSAAANRQLPEQWASAASAAASSPGGGASAPVAGLVTNNWLASFHAPQLDALAQEALAYNNDLQLAAARVEQAAAYQKSAGSTLYPQVNLLARGGGQLGGDASGLQGMGIIANWEIDLWGRVRSGAAAADAQYDSAALDAHYARQSIVAQVAKGWFLATEARMQKALADDTVAASTRAAGLAQDRLRVGVGDEYDLRVAQANLQSLRDSALSLEQAYRQAVRSLEILAGRYPAAALAVPAEL
ncbi:MAG TPA: TolC family protein, partial [Rhizobacter sp.]|nr:TolC family protein [Rhizobacter sp.]